MLVPGLANATARRLRSGSVRAAALAAAWCLLWFGVNAFDGLPKALKGGLDVYSFLGGLVFGLPPVFLAWGLIAFVRYHPSTTDGEAILLAHPWEEGLRIKVRPRFVRWTAGAVLFLVLSPLPYLVAVGITRHARTDLSFRPRRATRANVGASMVVLAVVYWGVRIVIAGRDERRCSRAAR